MPIKTRFTQKNKNDKKQRHKMTANDSKARSPKKSPALRCLRKLSWPHPEARFVTFTWHREIGEWNIRKINDYFGSCRRLFRGWFNLVMFW